MRRLTAAGDRFGQARDLASVLDAACDAFEEILAVIGDHEDASDALVVPLLLAATQAANGRDAVLFAPSLPARRLHQLGVGDELPPAQQRPPAATLNTTAGSATLVNHALASSNPKAARLLRQPGQAEREEPEPEP